MAKFRVTSAFEIEGTKPIFVLAGANLLGEIRQGMHVHIPFDSGITMTARIDTIEFARRTVGGEDICLCFKLDPEMLEIWRGLNLQDETLDITTDGSD